MSCPEEETSLPDADAFSRMQSGNPPWYALAEWSDLGERVLWHVVHSPSGDHLNFALFSSGTVVYRKKGRGPLHVARDVDVPDLMSKTFPPGWLDAFVALRDGYRTDPSLFYSRSCMPFTIIGVRWGGRERTVSVYNYHRGTLSSFLRGPGRSFDRVLDAMLGFELESAVPLDSNEWCDLDIGYVLRSKWVAREDHSVRPSKELVHYYASVLKNNRSDGD